MLTPLADDFDLYVPDRRGRGDSGDGAEYDIEREVADLRALAEVTDGPPTVFGHSFGGLVALAAAPRLAVDRYVLYEPALLVGEHRGADLSARMERRPEAGRRLDALRVFVEESGGIPDVDLLPWWPAEANTHLVETVVREVAAVESFDPAAVPDIEVPTLLVTGEDSPAHLRGGVFRLADSLPRGRLAGMEGVGHVGIESAPERLASLVTAFVRED
jgi:pimeloyl-ACP methyl ester carboxylesterase